MTIVFIGLSITSSWGNGHATTYRALVRGLSARGHDVLFLERDAEWYAGNRDMPKPPFCRTALYDSVAQLRARHLDDVRGADVVVVGSFVPNGIEIGDWVHRVAGGITAFYDIDTPSTLARLLDGVDYLAPRQIARYDVYLSFTGGPILDRLERQYGARMARPLYCSVSTDLYFPDREAASTPDADLGYLGTYSDDRQPQLERLMLNPALRWPSGRFVVAGPQYPAEIQWPPNVKRVVHLEPRLHRRFYTKLRFTLNVTRQDMVAAGYSPSVRLFEAAACGTPIISDGWPGLEQFFEPGSEILVARNGDDTLRWLRQMSEEDRVSVGERARLRVLSAHTALHRAADFEAIAKAVSSAREPLQPRRQRARMAPAEGTP